MTVHYHHDAAAAAAQPLPATVTVASTNDDDSGHNCDDTAVPVVAPPAPNTLLSSPPFQSYNRSQQQQHRTSSSSCSSSSSSLRNRGGSGGGGGVSVDRNHHASRRFNYMQRLWLKKRIKKALDRDSNQNVLALIHELQKNDQDSKHSSDSPHGGGKKKIMWMIDRDRDRDRNLIADLSEQVKDQVRQSHKLAQNRGLETRLNSYDLHNTMGQVEYPLEVRVQNFFYTVTVEHSSASIRTVFNSSFVYSTWRMLDRLWRDRDEYRRRTNSTNHHYHHHPNHRMDNQPAHRTKRVLDNINLVIEPGKSYLLLGPPGSGKTSLLRAITGILHPREQDDVNGRISYNGRTLGTKGEFHIENAFSYISQLDKHSPRLTVQETFDFASQCKSGAPSYDHNMDDLSTQSDLPDEGMPFLSSHHYSNAVGLGNLSLKLMGLEDVKDKYVSQCSGGQYRRITIGEMLTSQASVLCGDEISNGLDASSTYDMIQSLLYVGRLNQLTRIFSLLQPSPETVSLFDEIVVLAEGRILYAGPVEKVQDYFTGIGYVCPSFIDVADFILLVSSDTEDGHALYQKNGTAPTLPQLADLFLQSRQGKLIFEKLVGPHQYLWKENDGVSMHDSSFVSQVSFSPHLQRQYANSFVRSTWLITKRFLTLWMRDTRLILVAAIKNIVMGASVGGVFVSTSDPISIQGALFQAMLFVVLGAMQGASALVSDRVIFYKHYDANFYSTWPFVFGRAMAQIPQTTIDTVTFATILYYLVGLGGRTHAGNYFVYLSLLLVFAFLMQQLLAVFASFASAGHLTAYNAGVVLFLILFGGFIVLPETIPLYFSWLYWWNPFAWTYRALIVNEFTSSRWDNPEAYLRNAGFNDYSGDPYGVGWIRWSFIYTIPFSIACILLCALGLRFLRRKESNSSCLIDPSSSRDWKEKNSNTNNNNNSNNNNNKGVFSSSNNFLDFRFTPVTMTFRDVCYDVKSSNKMGESIRLLSEVSGIFRPGRLTALMGCSGSGKSTLCDVLSLRKRSGSVTGVVSLNGWPQECNSFRRCSGYVEQFDVQSPELTVFETILFSAKLRLDPELTTTDEEKEAFVEQLMNQVELFPLRDALVGTEDDLGLSFEQKKRLSIAVELAASPSIIFLDEPTTGLDSRNALLIMKTLRRIANEGRTVVTTIHQPSSAVFDMFDDLLLLKNGASIFCGDLGSHNCSQLVNYFESKGAQRIEFGDNPANWVLREIESMNSPAAQYSQSKAYASLLSEIDGIEKFPGEKITYTHKFSMAFWRRRFEINRRLRTIYWRSPSYNLSRLVVSLVIAVILGSAFLSKRDATTYSESEMRARVSVIFLSFIVTGLMAIVSVLPVMTKIRDMFYRHRDAHMYDSASMGIALGVAEQVFILVSTAIFSTAYLAVVGIGQPDEPLPDRVERAIGFWGFFTFNFAIYSYFGQLFVCLVESMPTAIILSSVFIGLNNFFSGLIVRPQFLVGTVYEIPYRITPGHYVYDGLIGCLYAGNTGIVVADPGTEFEQYLLETTQCISSAADCRGTAHEFIYVFFGGEYGMQGPMVPCIVLGVFLTLARILTWVALKYIRFG